MRTATTSGAATLSGAARAAILATISLPALPVAAGGVVDLELFWEGAPGPVMADLVGPVVCHVCDVGEGRTYRVKKLVIELDLVDAGGKPLAHGCRALRLRARDALDRWGPWAAGHVIIPAPADLRTAGGEWFLDRAPSLEAAPAGPEPGAGSPLEVHGCAALLAEGEEALWTTLDLGPLPLPGAPRIGFRLVDTAGAWGPIHWASLFLPGCRAIESVIVTPRGPLPPEAGACEMAVACPPDCAPEVPLARDAGCPGGFSAEVDPALFGTEDLAALPLWVRAECSSGATLTPLTPPPSEPAPAFVRGDCNSDGEVTGDVTDAVYLLNFSFLNGRAPPCAAACDANGDGRFSGTVTDPVFLLNFTFLVGPPPPRPFPCCGPGGPSDLALGCETPPAACRPGR